MPREITNDDLADEWADRQALSPGYCRCHFEMPGSCPGPHNCPMCQPDDEALVAADLAYNAAKATHHERADARAIYDQAMLNTLLGASL